MDGKDGVEVLAESSWFGIMGVARYHDLIIILWLQGRLLFDYHGLWAFDARSPIAKSSKVTCRLGEALL